MATLSDYMSGTISLANGSVTVTGTGTLFEVTRFREGDTLQIQNLTAVIASVDSDTQLTLAEPWTGIDIVDGPYRARQLGDGSRVSTQAATIIELLGNGVLMNLAELGVEEGKVPVGGPTGEYELRDQGEIGIQDPNGSLGKLAALTLAARQILQTDAAGALKQIALAANKFLRTDGNGDIVLSDLGTAAIALLNLSGTAAADQLPYLSSASGASLTTLTAYARTILDDTTGTAMFATMGATQSLGAGLSTGYQKLPSGLIIQWGSSVVTTGGEVALINYPIAYPTGVFSTVICNGDTNQSPSVVFGIHAYNSNSAFTMRTNGLSGTVRTNWISVGR